jgi:hypothetical protein
MIGVDMKHHEIPNRARMAMETSNKRDVHTAVMLGQLCSGCEHLRIRHTATGGCAGGELVEVSRVGSLPIFEIQDSDCKCQESQILILESSLNGVVNTNADLCRSITNAKNAIRLAEWHRMNDRTKYAVMKEGRKSALRVKGLDAYDKAWHWAMKNGHVVDGKLAQDISIQTRQDGRSQEDIKYATLILEAVQKRYEFGRVSDLIEWGLIELPKTMEE